MDWHSNTHRKRTSIKFRLFLQLGNKQFLKKIITNKIKFSWDTDSSPVVFALNEYSRGRWERNHLTISFLLPITPLAPLGRGCERRLGRGGGGGGRFLYVIIAVCKKHPLFAFRLSELRRSLLSFRNPGFALFEVWDSGF